jgi:outer membrane receptor protein involved in Fe transport
VNGLRLGVEWQHQGSYFLDPQNSEKYKGFDVFHVRAGYRYRAFELWVNMMNAGDSYYSYFSSKSGSSYSYTPADPRNANIGLSYDFSDLFQK